ncbi:TadE/TadG family type IV pilus assembly protein [Phycicoccus mangrovi]|uniref:TadE/TadG family type IV pilus assembly protein n=1 Tax=Phycicoccus mangrovi TaxID=2840470 RepID=UPI001D018160|nr:TadE/TadG family type IV pilus assembly protein [Phycicoccus mangrovi]
MSHRLSMPSRADRPGRAGEHERGVATVQLVVLMPALFTLLFLGVQAAVLSHGRTVAIAAAQEGARAAAAQNGTTISGRAAATAFVAAAGGDGVLKGVRVTALRTASSATITVTATTMSVVPGWTPRVTQSASAPTERITQ